MLFVWKENTSGCSVLRICKLLNCLVVQRGIMLCQNNNPHCFLLPPRPNCQSKPCQKSFKFPPLIYITPSLNPHFVFPFAHSYPSFSFLFFPPQVVGGLKTDVSPDDSDLEARLNSWNLGVSPGARLELLGNIQLSACSSSPTAAVQRC